MDFGGFNRAPKFPPHGALRVLIYEYRRTHNENLLRMITTHARQYLAWGHT